MIEGQVFPLHPIPSIFLTDRTPEEHGQTGSQCEDGGSFVHGCWTAEEIDESVYDCLGTKNAVAAFVSYGSTAPDQVRAQINRWTEVLSPAS